MQGRDPTQQALLELGRLDRSQNRVEPIVRRDAGAEIEKLRQPLPLLAAEVGDGDEIVGPQMTAQMAIVTMLISG